MGLDREGSKTSFFQLFSRKIAADMRTGYRNVFLPAGVVSLVSGEVKFVHLIREELKAVLALWQTDYGLFQEQKLELH